MCVNLLVKAGARLDLKAFNQTALQMSREMNHSECVAILDTAFSDHGLTPAVTIEEGLYLIRSVDKKEFLYCGSNFLDGPRRHALTWIGNANQDPAMRWQLKSNGAGNHHIYNMKQREYLYTGTRFLEKTHFRYALTWVGFIRLLVLFAPSSNPHLPPYQAGNPNQILPRDISWELVDIGDSRYRIR